MYSRPSNKQNSNGLYFVVKEYLACYMEDKDFAEILWNEKLNMNLQL